VVPSGQLVGNNTIFASYLTASVGVTANQPTNWATVDEDAYACVTTGSGWKFTCPVGGGGVYSIDMNGVSSTAMSFYVYKNNASYRVFFSMNASIYYAGSRKIRLAPGDYIDIRTDTNGTLTNSAIQISRIAT
jgi:hypothetical protein